MEFQCRLASATGEIIEGVYVAEPDEWEALRAQYREAWVTDR